MSDGFELTSNEYNISAAANTENPENPTHIIPQLTTLNMSDILDPYCPLVECTNDIFNSPEPAQLNQLANGKSRVRKEALLSSTSSFYNDENNIHEIETINENKSKGDSNANIYMPLTLIHQNNQNRTDEEANTECNNNTDLQITQIYKNMINSVEEQVTDPSEMITESIIPPNNQNMLDEEGKESNNTKDQTAVNMINSIEKQVTDPSDMITESILIENISNDNNNGDSDTLTNILPEAGIRNILETSTLEVMNSMVNDVCDRNDPSDNKIEENNGNDIEVVVVGNENLNGLMVEMENIEEYNIESDASHSTIEDSASILKNLNRSLREVEYEKYSQPSLINTTEKNNVSADLNEETENEFRINSRKKKIPKKKFQEIEEDNLIVESDEKSLDDSDLVQAEINYSQQQIEIKTTEEEEEEEEAEEEEEEEEEVEEEEEEEEAEEGMEENEEDNNLMDISPFFSANKKTKKKLNIFDTNSKDYMNNFSSPHTSSRDLVFTEIKITKVFHAITTYLISEFDANKNLESKYTSECEFVGKFESERKLSVDEFKGIRNKMLVKEYKNLNEDILTSNRYGTPEKLISRNKNDLGINRNRNNSETTSKRSADLVGKTSKERSPGKSLEENEIPIREKSASDDDSANEMDKNKEGNIQIKSGDKIKRRRSTRNRRSSLNMSREKITSKKRQVEEIVDSSDSDGPDYKKHQTTKSSIQIIPTSPNFQLNNIKIKTIKRTKNNKKSIEIETNGSGKENDGEEQVKNNNNKEKIVNSSFDLIQNEVTMSTTSINETDTELQLQQKQEDQLNKSKSFVRLQRLDLNSLPSSMAMTRATKFTKTNLQIESGPPVERLNDKIDIKKTIKINMDDPKLKSCVEVRIKKLTNEEVDSYKKFLVANQKHSRKPSLQLKNFNIINNNKQSSKKRVPNTHKKRKSSVSLESSSKDSSNSEEFSGSVRCGIEHSFINLMSKSMEKPLKIKKKTVHVMPMNSDLDKTSSSSSTDVIIKQDFTNVYLLNDNVFVKPEHGSEYLPGFIKQIKQTTNPNLEIYEYKINFYKPSPCSDYAGVPIDKPSWVSANEIIKVEKLEKGDDILAWNDSINWFKKAVYHETVIHAHTHLQTNSHKISNKKKLTLNIILNDRHIDYDISQIAIDEKTFLQLVTRAATSSDNTIHVDTQNTNHFSETYNEKTTSTKGQDRGTKDRD